MAGTRILVKLDGPVQETHEIKLAFGGSGKFQSGTARRLCGLTPAEQEVGATWYVVEQGPQGVGFGSDSAHPWDVAHAAVQQRFGLAETAGRILHAEPDLIQGWTWLEPSVPGADMRTLSAADPCSNPKGQDAHGAYEKGPQFGWHLGDEYSGLATARAMVGDAIKNIKIFHLDTGYDPNHHGLPPGIVDEPWQRDFVDLTPGRKAYDESPSALGSPGHGMGTIGILAGGDVAGLRSGIAIPPDCGPIGGAAGARVIPLRIANRAAEFSTSTVAEAINYAVVRGADVICMSMGGLPSQAWADAVNSAYDAGVVIVCAAGNSFAGFPTGLIVYPARFKRVIAACGVMAGGHPYHALGGPMEGNVGPKSKMDTTLAAYTPNIPWLRHGCPDIVDSNGGGTSAATAQIAAAAALWLAKNGTGYARDGRRVEAVRSALFESAGSGPAGIPLKEGAQPNFGCGTLRAAAALAIAHPAHLTPTTEAIAGFPFLRLLSGAFGMTRADADHPRSRMFAVEITQLALNSRGAREAVPDPGLNEEMIPASACKRMLEAILDERFCSLELRAHLEQLLGRAGVGATVTVAPSKSGASSEPQAGSEIKLRAVTLPPSRRRLKIFATDPGDSNRLGTAFINTATVEIPWEKLEPGPVGEYIEVVDIDPASHAVYEPVDLQDDYLLAQDGFSPSEGLPQFHQQMVYAVSMRTIRNFEIALGRRALWAERILPPKDDIGGKDGSAARPVFQPAPDGGYVGRLRIYPHALREQNAYYSPDKKALLFGYFDAGDGDGERTVFNCLSHDVVAHETTHALLDGLHRRYQEQTNEDVLSFHEAFADIVAIFQHFTFPELLRHQIGQLRGDLTQESILSDLARQFGQSLHNGRALRRALDPKFRRLPDAALGQFDREPNDGRMTYADASEPHERGAILVAAVYDAFVSVYMRRSADLFRLASGGTGILRPGSIHPDLVERLAQTSVEVAQRVLTTAIRALDYMPPVDPTFGDYLRALITADKDQAPDHGAGYRVALAEAFATRGIYAENVRSVGPDSLAWKTLAGPVQSARLNAFVQKLNVEAFEQDDRRRAFKSAKENARALHQWMSTELDEGMARDLGLDFSRDAHGKQTIFEVHSVRPARRSTDEGEPRMDIVAVITQKAQVAWDPSEKTIPPVERKHGSFWFRGGCTLILDRQYDTDPIRYAVTRPVYSESRQDRQREYLIKANGGPNAGYSPPAQTTGAPANKEPFAAFHTGLGDRETPVPHTQLHKVPAYISYSDFVGAVEEGLIKSVVVQGRSISGQSTTNRSFQTYAPDDPRLFDRLSAKNVPVVVRPEE